MVVEGHALANVVLGGYVLGAPIGTAPVVIVVGGITASPFPFGDAASATDPWWPALHGTELIDPTTTTILCPCWPGNGSTWQGFDDGPIPWSYGRRHDEHGAGIGRRTRGKVGVLRSKLLETADEVTALASPTWRGLTWTSVADSSSLTCQVFSVATAHSLSAPPSRTVPT